MSLTAVAKLPGQVELSDQKDYVVLPEPIELANLLRLGQKRLSVVRKEITTKHTMN